MADLYSDNIQEQIDDLFYVETKEIAEPVVRPVVKEVVEPKQKSVIKEEVYYTEEEPVSYIEQMAQQMSRVSKRTNLAAGQEKITEEQLTLNNFQVQIDGIRRALRESTIVSGIGQGGDGQTPGSGEVKLSKLDDVNVSGIQDGETLVWNSTLNQFIPGVAVGGSGGDIDGGNADGNQSSRGDNPPSGDPIDLTGYATEVYVQNEIAAIPPVDLSGHATTIYVDDAIAAIPSVDLSNHATKVYVDDAIAAIPAPDFTGYATESYVDDAVAAVPTPDLSVYATETYVNDAVASVPAPDFTGYATETYVDDAIENLGDILNFKGILDFTTNPQPDTFSAGDVYVNTGTGTPDASWSLSGDVSSGEMYGRGENQWGLIGSSGVDLTGYATETYVDQQDDLKVNRSGDTIKGQLTISAEDEVSNDGVRFYVKDTEGETNLTIFPTGVVTGKNVIRVNKDSGDCFQVKDSTGTTVKYKVDSQGNIESPRLKLMGGNSAEADERVIDVKNGYSGRLSYNNKTKVSWGASNVWIGSSTTVGESNETINLNLQNNPIVDVSELKITHQGGVGKKLAIKGELADGTTDSDDFFYSYRNADGTADAMNYNGKMDNNANLVNKKYVDDAVAGVSVDTSSAVQKTGDTMTGKLVLNNSSNAQVNFNKGGNSDIEYKGDWIVSFQGDSSPKIKLGAVVDMNSKKITNLASPTGDKDAVTKKYLEGAKMTASSNSNAKSGGFYYSGGRLYYKI